MTALINTITIHALTDPLLASTLNIIVILDMVILLVSQEIASAAGGDRAERWNHVLNTIAYPLIVVAIVVIVVRFGRIVAVSSMGRH